MPCRDAWTTWLPLIALNLVAVVLMARIIPDHATALTRLLCSLLLGAGVQGLYGYVVGFPFDNDPEKRFQLVA